jgi:TolB-like protein
MKRIVLLIVCAALAAAAFCQDALVLAPPQNDGGVEDGQVRTLTRLMENALQRTQKFEIIDRGAVEDILKEHGFQLSDLSDNRKTAELGKLLNADYLVRPSVMPLAGDLFLEARIVDVNTARMLNSAEVRIRYDLADAYEKLEGFAATLAGAAGARPASGTTETAIEVSAKNGGTLYFQDREVATLWDNETYVISIGKPGVYTVAMVFADGTKKSRSVTINARGLTQISFEERYVIGETGPAGGLVFHDKGRVIDGWRYLEAAPAETERRLAWNPAKQYCDTLAVNGYDDWRLPTVEELVLMYNNLHKKGLGEFKNNFYWSAATEFKYQTTYVYYYSFKDGGQDDAPHNGILHFRAVRAF